MLIVVTRHRSDEGCTFIAKSIANYPGGSYYKMDLLNAQKAGRDTRMPGVCMNLLVDSTTMAPLFLGNTMLLYGSATTSNGVMSNHLYVNSGGLNFYRTNVSAALYGFISVGNSAILRQYPGGTANSGLSGGPKTWRFLLADGSANFPLKKI